MVIGVPEKWLPMNKSITISEKQLIKDLNAVYCLTVATDWLSHTEHSKHLPTSTGEEEGRDTQTKQLTFNKQDSTPHFHSELPPRQRTGPH